MSKNAKRRQRQRQKKREARTQSGVLTPPPAPLQVAQPVSLSTVRQRFQLLKEQHHASR